MSNFVTHSVSLKDELLASIHIRETALPDFQRDFVWQPYQTKGLIVSLSKRFPAGTILRLESSKPIFNARAFDGAPELNGNTPKYLILDGQQRLSSLYQALYGAGDHQYFVSLTKLLDGVDFEDALFYERPETVEKYYDTLEQQARFGVLPLSVIFGGEGFYNWLYAKLKPVLARMESYGKKTAYSADDVTIDRVRQLYVDHLEPIEDYEFPVVTLKSDVSLEAVCTIFETLNSTGVKLSVFDLLAARFFAQTENLRARWSYAQENTSYLAEFGIDPYYVLQVIGALALNSVKRSDILKLSPEIVVRWWEDAIWGMDEALSLLYKECGVLKADLLSYNTILVPLAAAFAFHRSVTGPAIGTLRNRLMRWYWCSVFGQKYESSPTSQTIIDLKEVRQWIGGGEPPESIRTFAFDRDRLKTVTTRQRAIYRGVLCLILRQNPRDFHSTKVLTADVLNSGQVDDHHIFPDAYLKARTDLPQAEIDAIVNRTLIDRVTNQKIGKNPPSAYLDAIAAEWDNSSLLDTVLESHLLPVGDHSSLRRDDFEAFRTERGAALYELILNATKA